MMVLWADNWDDFGYKLTLNAKALIKGKEIELPRIKILIKNEDPTYKFLNTLYNDNWNGVFPIPDFEYISVPVSIDFYELLIGAVGIDEATACAVELKDASYLTFVEQSESALSLLQDSGFKTSLQRDSSAVVVFNEGHKLFNDINIKIPDFSFEFDAKDTNLNVDFVFDTEKRLLPSDINVLIGPNGIGKSQTLHNIVSTWLTPNKKNNSGKFSKNINVSNLIVVSYSPFELFPVDLQGLDAQIDESIYNYFGLRQRKKKLDVEKSTVGLSRTYPQLKAAQSLLNCAKDDAKYGAIKDWSNKIHTLEMTLEEAFEFDFAAIEIDSKIREDELFENLWGRKPVFIFEDKRYLKVNDEVNSELNFDLLDKHIIKHSGVSFFNEGHKLKLSSGQKLFSYIVINILGSIKKNSLILVDEPELFLHPSLEISFVSMLKKILKLYFSKAILATHSIVTVRETPRVCVHVYKEENGEVFINKPPFETFGGDIQRISSYVFGDKSTSKPYESWIKENLKEYGTAAKLITALGKDINEEMVMQIHAMEQAKWL
jgi:ABC-type cobalamin/Fe3+-siderophores transport system ATPase subunit